MIGNDFDFIETFPPLGHPEHHFNVYPNHPWLRSVKDIEDWIVENCVLAVNLGCKRSDFKSKLIEINEDLTVSIKRKLSPSIKLIKDISYIPIQFRSVNDFLCTSIGLKSLIGVPIRVNSIEANYNKLENLIGIKKESNIQKLYVNNNNIKNLKEIKNLKKIRDITIFDNPIESLKDLPEINDFRFMNKGWKTDSYKLLLEIPNGVSNVIINKMKFNDSRVKVSSGGFVDMNWLRKEQSLLEKKELLKNEINFVLDENDIGLKRRKL